MKEPSLSSMFSCSFFFIIITFIISSIKLINADIFTGEAQQAARKGDLEYFTTLLEVGIDDPIGFLNHQEQGSEQTPLLAAVLSGQTEIVKQLLNTGVDVTIPEKDGYTVMHAAAFQGRADVAKLLIERGIDANDVSKDGFTPFHRTLWTKSHRHMETMKVLLDIGKVDVDFLTNVGKTGAYIALEMKHVEALEVLLKEYGANPNFRNKRGDALIHVAIRAQDVESLDVLLKNGADIMLDDGKGKSCRKIAKQLRSKAILEKVNRAYEKINDNNNNDNNNDADSNSNSKAEL